jgi:hypothetical protein
VRKHDSVLLDSPHNVEIEFRRTGRRSEMPTVALSDQTFRLLSEQALKRNTSIENVIASALTRYSESEPLPVAEPTIEDRLRAFEAWTKSIESRAERYPPGHVIHDSRESIYEEREKAHL